MQDLPDKLSDLLELALNDLAWVESRAVTPWAESAPARAE